MTEEQKEELNSEVDEIQQNHLSKLGEFYLTINEPTQFAEKKDCEFILHDINKCKGPARVNK